MVDMEEWKGIPFLNGKYEVSNLGRIRNTDTKRIRKTPISKRGYPVFSANVNGIRKLISVHKCVAVTFIPNDENLPQVNHIDGIKFHNFVNNLEWVSARDNNLHARKTGLHNSDGDKAVVQIENGKVIAEYKSAALASRITGINRSCICNVCNNRISNGKHHKTAGGFAWKWKKDMML